MEEIKSLIITIWVMVYFALLLLIAILANITKRSKYFIIYLDHKGVKCTTVLELTKKELSCNWAIHDRITQKHFTPSVELISISKI